MEGFVFQPPKISLHFGFPKLFEIHFNRVEDYRAKLSLDHSRLIRDWSASRDSEFLRELPERRRRRGHSPGVDPTQLCHFHLTFDDGYLDVLAEEFVFMMVSR